MKRSYKYFAMLAGLCFMVILSPPAFAASDLESGIKDLAQQISKSMTSTGKKKIAVVEFSNLDGVITAFGQHLAEELITELFLVSPGQFEVVERRQLMKVMDELKLGTTGLLDSKSLKEIGKILSIDAIVTGSVTDLENNVKVNARMIGVKTAKVFAVARAKIPKIGVVANLMAKEVGGGQGGKVYKSTRLATQTNSEQQKGMQVFQNEFLVVKIFSVKKNFSTVDLIADFENTSDEKYIYAIYSNSYLIDENGGKWKIADLKNVGEWSEMIPHIKIRGNIKFKSVNNSNGSLFNMILKCGRDKASTSSVIRGIRDKKFDVIIRELKAG